MRARHLLLLSLPWLLQGCGGSSSSNLSAGGPSFNAPAGGGTTTPADLNAPVLQNVNIQVRMTFVEPEEATNFTIQVFDANSNAPLAGPLSFQRTAGQAIPDQLFTGLTGNFFRVVVQAEDTSGKPVGTLDTVLPATSQQLQALFSQLPILPPTRETGRISVSAVEPGLRGDSNEPAISRDGRFVAFSSLNPGLLNSLGTLTRARAIYLRDRKSNTTELISAVLSIRNGSTTELGDGSVRFINSSVSGGVTDGSSNTALIGEVSGPANEARDPDVSADGRFIAYEQENLGSQVRLKDRQGSFGLTEFGVSPAQVTAGVTRLQVTQGFDPSLSGDGQLLAYTGVISGRPNQIILFDRPSQSSRILSKTAVGLLADGECAHPTFSPDGKLVFFSTVATNLAGGQGGLMVFDVNSQTFTRLAQPSAFACSVSDTGRFVVANIDNRLRLLDRQNNTDVEIPIPGALAAVRAPSISGDGRFVTFYSARTDLVSNDANGKLDVFVIDLQTLQLSRINLAGDGVAVQGGVDQTLSEGPVISKDGTRIAYASPDDMLVPRDLNNSVDVFSSSNPTGGKLYVIGSNGRILRFDNIATANGNLSPAATMTTPLLTGGLTRFELYLDSFNDRLYVAGGPVNGRIFYIDNVSTKDGDVTATKFRGIGSTTAPGLFVDVERNLLYKGNQVFPSATGLAEPVRTVTETPTQILVDTRFQQLIFGNVGALRFYTAGTATNNPATRVVAPDRGNCRGLQFDPSPLGSTLSNNSNFSLTSEGAAIGTSPLTGFNSLAVLDPTGVLLKLLRGNQTLLGSNSPTSAPGPHVIDVTTGHTYCTNGLENRILVFHKPTQDNGDKAPDRILNLPILPRAMALDRTR